MTTGISIVIPHFGPAGPALALLRQLREGAAEVRMQVIVVDDCSPEPFPVTEADDGPDPDVLVFRRAENGGFGAAVNTGAALATEPLLLIMNSDLALPPGFVDELLAAATPWLPAVVAPSVERHGRRSGGHHFPRARFEVVQRTALLARWQDQGWWWRATGKVEPPGRGQARRVDWVTGEVILVPTRAFLEVGGFDEGFFMYAEEVDLQRRLTARGVSSVLVGTTPVVHAGGASTDPAMAAAWLTQSRLRYAAKWGGLFRLRVAMTLGATATLATQSVRQVLGRPVTPWSDARRDLAAAWAPALGPYLGRSHEEDAQRCP